MGAFIFVAINVNNKLSPLSDPKAKNALKHYYLTKKCKMNSLKMPCGIPPPPPYCWQVLALKDREAKFVISLPALCVLSDFSKFLAVCWQALAHRSHLVQRRFSFGRPRYYDHDGEGILLLRSRNVGVGFTQIGVDGELSCSSSTVEPWKSNQTDQRAVT